MRAEVALSRLSSSHPGLADGGGRAYHQASRLSLHVPICCEAPAKGKEAQIKITRRLCQHFLTIFFDPHCKVCFTIMTFNLLVFEDEAPIVGKLYVL